MLAFTRWHRLISLLLLSPLLASPFILITLRVRLLFGAAKSSPYLITMFAWRPLSLVLLLVIFCLVGLRWVIWRETRSPLYQCSRCIFFFCSAQWCFREKKNSSVMKLLTTKSIFRTWLVISIRSQCCWLVQRGIFERTESKVLLGYFIFRGRQGLRSPYLP